MTFYCSSPIVIRQPISYGARTSPVRKGGTQGPVLVTAMATPQKDDEAAASSSSSSQKSTKLVTFLGKGGSGKTTSAVFAAQVLFLQFLHFFGCSVFYLMKGNSWFGFQSIREFRRGKKRKSKQNSGNWVQSIRLIEFLALCNLGRI